MEIRDLLRILTTLLRPRRDLRAAALSLALSLCAPCTAQPAQPYEVVIDAPAPLARQLNESLDISRYVREQTMPAEEFRRLAGAAIGQIRTVLATEGYFSAQVQQQTETRGEQLVARFTVTPGPQTVIESVSIQFSGHIAANPASAARIERLRRQWSLKAGQAFRQKDWTDAKNDLLKNLLNRDYPAARIADSEARIDPERQRAQLSVQVDSGPAFTFGELRVQGLSRYPRRTVDAQNPIQPGEPYSQDKLNELQSRIQATGYFKSAFATTEIDPAHPLEVPVHLDLVEHERRRLALGGGISTDTGAHLQARWLDRRFLGRDWRLESEARVDRVTRIIGGELSFPRRENGWTPSIAANYAHTDINSEINDKIRTVARLTSPSRTDENVWSLAWMIDRQQLPNADPNNRQALVGSWRYTRRRLDNLFSPRRGHVAVVELGGGPAGLLNERNIGRAWTQFTLLRPLTRRWSGVLRAQAGQVFGASREQVPDDLLFRTGGDQTVRGYAYNSLGVAQSGAIVSGRVMALVSGELVYHFTPEWGAAVFSDAGNAADSWRDFHFARSTGVGARWRSPVGPVNFDLAFGHETRKPRLHFSIGYGF
ncbi:autotransporter assembly complex protein TamA [Lacisediminimonas profundi]|uniref:autotransporter assembly complex protein TamA n=1 Tax=Lacisediminimonas profundi TaxID=2603856 RepID=UPI00124B48BF|nr:autotransporter assembly complex family protein [Lacisediminimonas profundi]